MTTLSDKAMETVRKRMRNIWPAFASMLENPELQKQLATEGIEVDWDAIRQLGTELGIHVAVCPDNRVRAECRTSANSPQKGFLCPCCPARFSVEQECWDHLDEEHGLFYSGPDSVEMVEDEG